MVSPASSTVTVSTIPTVFDAIRPKIPIKYWWLRSPNTTYINYAWFVTSSGVVDDGSNSSDYIWDSYGREDRRHPIHLLMLGEFICVEFLIILVKCQIPTGEI